MPLLVFHRGSQYANKLRKYKIYIDERFVGEIGEREDKAIEVSPGVHRVFLKIDWCTSKVHNVDVRDNDVVHFKCASRITGIKLLFVIWYLFRSHDQWVYLEVL